jgi:hypothetical protein
MRHGVAGFVYPAGITSAWILAGQLTSPDPGADGSQRLAVTSERRVRGGHQESEPRSGQQISLDLQREAPELGAICSHTG